MKQIPDNTSYSMFLFVAVVLSCSQTVEYESKHCHCPTSNLVCDVFSLGWLGKGRLDVVLFVVSMLAPQAGFIRSRTKPLGSHGFEADRAFTQNNSSATQVLSKK